VDEGAFFTRVVGDLSTKIVVGASKMWGHAQQSAMAYTRSCMGKCVAGDIEQVAPPSELHRNAIRPTQWRMKRNLRFATCRLYNLSSEQFCSILPQKLKGTKCLLGLE